MHTTPIAQSIADILKVPVNSILSAITLLDEGSTVPFIARYRKEVTNGLDDTQLRFIEERLIYLREMKERRETILKSIEEQGHLTDVLKEAINHAETKTLLEDLYLPYRPKRHTKAQNAREAGLEPLALQLWKHFPEDFQSKEKMASEYVNLEKKIKDTATALEGAREILMEIFSENAALLSDLREYLWKQGVLSSKVIKGQEKKGEKFRDYFNYQEQIKRIPSHRILALLRAKRENFIRLSLDVPQDIQSPCSSELAIAKCFEISSDIMGNKNWLSETVRLAWKSKVQPKLEQELMTRLRESAEDGAISVFAKNLRDLLLSAPAGEKTTMGLDPGIRTGVKVAIVDKTGKYLDSGVIYPHQPQNDWFGSLADLAKLAIKHNVDLISIGNGTASRETDRLAGDLIKMYPDLNMAKMMVSEAGASVYSASEYASKEFPDLDVTLRGAVSIARRLQDPLAELVKIEPKALGVGQYQHDVGQSKLGRCLGSVVEDCVNAVGVDVNTASAALLKKVSGLNDTLAKNLVEYRDQHGKFESRQALNNIPRMGEKTFQQCAGFLRVPNGIQPLDASGVHPESYSIVEKILQQNNISNIHDLLGNLSLLNSLNAENFVDEQHGLPTVRDIISELKKPGRDPRPEFKTATFKEGVEELKHLQVGMILEGVVGNVTSFGVFVDIGVHQHGLIHISQIPRSQKTQDQQIVGIKAGEVVQVRVIELDIERKRIGLSLRLTEAPPREAREPRAQPRSAQSDSNSNDRKPAFDRNTERTDSRNNHNNRPFDKKFTPNNKQEKPKEKPLFNSAMADALAKLKG